MGMLQQRVNAASAPSPFGAATANGSVSRDPMRDLVLAKVKVQAAEAQRVVTQLQSMVSGREVSRIRIWLFWLFSGFIEKLGFCV